MQVRHFTVNGVQYVPCQNPLNQDMLQRGVREGSVSSDPPFKGVTGQLCGPEVVPGPYSVHWVLANDCLGLVR